MINDWKEKGENERKKIKQYRVFVEDEDDEEERRKITNNIMSRLQDRRW